MFQDLHYGIRVWLKNPGFTLIAVLTLALGIGANTAIFSFVNALLLRPLAGVAEPEQLVQVGRKYPDKSYLSDSSYPDYLDYRGQNSVMSGLAIVSPAAFHLSTGQEAERVDGELVSANYFDVLGVRAAQGRLINSGDEHAAGAGSVAVLSFRLWQRRFGGGADVIGKTIKLDGHDFIVVGVASEQFEGTKVGTPHDIWAPILTLRQTDPKVANRFNQRGPSWLEMFGRLKPGVTIEQARAEFSTIAERLKQSYPQVYGKVGVAVEPGVGRDIETRREVRRFAYVPFTAVGIVLLIACANVAGLMLARGSARQKEIGIRLALGKGRNLFEPAGPMLYLPLLQNYQPSTVLHLRTIAAQEEVNAAMLREVSALDPNLPVYSIKPLTEHLTATLTPQRLLAHLITGFGLLALLLAGIGLYGLLAYTVAQRTPEIGIRMAFGAQPGAVLRLVMAQGMNLALLGVGLGLAAAFGLTRLLKSLLFGVSTLDPLTFGVGVVMLVIVALLACYVPARRAAKTDPLAAVRCE